MRDQAIVACVDAGFRPRVVQEVPDTLTMIALVAAGIGATVLLSRFAEEAPEGLVFLNLMDVDRYLHTVVAWRESQRFGALGRVLEIIEPQMPSPGH